MADQPDPHRDETAPDDEAEVDDEATPDDEGDGIEVAFLPPDLPRADVLSFLRTATIDPVGRLMTASNVTLLCRLTLAGAAADGTDLEATCVYKPIRGEAPLWDFPDGSLAGREVAAFELSEALGLGIVPPTVLRDGPFGPGMAQLWVDVDESVDRVELVRADAPTLRPIALFDAIVNNADRKVGHLLPTAGGSIHGVDHGVTFHHDPKLRTVLWGWMGEPFTKRERALLERVREELAGGLGETLGRTLRPLEVTATDRRVERLLEAGRFPSPDPDRPAIPWPWY